MCGRRKYHAIVLLLLVSVYAPLGAAGQDPIAVVLSTPTSGAAYVLPQTKILLRLKSPLDVPASALIQSVTVSATRSGIHAGALRLARDRRSLIFAPGTPFLWADTVTVTLASPLVIMNGQGKSSRSFSFTIAAEPPPPAPTSMESELVGGPGQTSPPASPPLPPLARASDDTLPYGFPPIATSIGGETAEGWLFLASLSYPPNSSIPFLLVVDDEGRPSFAKAMPDRCYDFKILPDGRLSYFDAQQSAFILMDAAYHRLGQYACGNGYVADPHDLCISPDGHAWLMAYDVQYVDMSAVVTGGLPHAAVTGLILQELDEDGVVVFQWRSWDHFEITDATHEDLHVPTIDYVHGNALDLDADGNPVLSCRHMDEITKIDRQTGDILWRWGGKHNEFTFLDDTLRFSHQHDVRRLVNGHFTMFDNGNYHVPAHSRALEYEVDEVKKTARLVWQYRNTPDIFGFALGSVQRLENGNTLICWGATSPTLTEVKPNGQPVFTLWLGPNIYSYRGYRFPLESIASGVPPQVPTRFAVSDNFPNPFNGITRLAIDLPRDAQLSVTVYDILGREVFVPVREHHASAGTSYVTLDFGAYPSGVYVCRINAGDYVAQRKVVLSK